MTTIIGVKAGQSEREGIVLLADRQSTEYGKDKQEIAKSESRKIFIEPNGRFAIAGAGDSHALAFIDPEVGNYKIKATEVKSSFLCAATENTVNNVLETNETKRWYDRAEEICGEKAAPLFREENQDSLYGIILIYGIRGMLKTALEKGSHGEVLVASRLGSNPKLFYIPQEPEESVLPLESLYVLGSGQELAKEILDGFIERYLEIDQYQNVEEIDFSSLRFNCDMGTAIKEGIRTLEHANRDMFSSGLDLVVVQREGVYDFGRAIDERVRNVREEEIAKMLRHYDPAKSLEDRVSYESPKPIS